MHWLKRRTIALTHVAEVPYSKRMAIMLASYHHVVQQTFGLSEKADLQRRQTLPGMPEMPADLVQKGGRNQSHCRWFRSFFRWLDGLTLNGWQLLNAVNGCFIGGALNDACVLLVIMVDGELRLGDGR